MICGERFIRPRSGRASKDKFAPRRVRTVGHYVCSGYLIYAEGRSGNAYWECLTKMWQSHNTAVPHDAAHGPWVAGSRTGPDIYHGVINSHPDRGVCFWGGTVLSYRDSRQCGASVMTWGVGYTCCYKGCRSPPVE